MFLMICHYTTSVPEPEIWQIPSLPSDIVSISLPIITTLCPAFASDLTEFGAKLVTGANVNVAAPSTLAA